MRHVHYRKVNRAYEYQTDKKKMNLKELNRELLYELAIPLVGINLRDLKGGT